MGSEYIRIFQMLKACFRDRWVWKMGLGILEFLVDLNLTYNDYKQNIIGFFRFILKIKMKIFKLVLIGFIAIGLFISVCLYQILGISFVSELDYKGSKITIKRVEHNIPEVHANSFEAALYGWGYVTAEDRLFQLAFKRVSIQGRLSKYLGEKTIEVDKMFREINLYGWAQQVSKKFQGQNITQYNNFKAYAQGINAYYKTRTLKPLQFWMIGLDWQPWTVTDMIAVFKLIKWSLSFGMTEEYYRSMLLNNYTKEEIDNFLAYEEFRWLEGDVVTHTTIVKDQELPINMTSKEKTVDATKVKPVPVSKLLPIGDFEQIDVDQRASNSWVISGNHTQSGHAILSNDPHLQSTLPPQWYQIKVFYPDKNGEQLYIIGGSMVGIPVFIGKTTYVSSTMTVNYVDAQDLYKQKIDGLKYLLDDEWIPLKVRTENIQIKGAQPLEYKVYETHRGPIIRHLISTGYLYKIPDPVSLRWLGYTDHDYLSLVQYVHMAEVKSHQQLLEMALDKGDYGPPFNMIYSTKDNHIGYVALCRIPIRRHPHTGMYVQDGSKSQNDWVGFITGRDRLHVYDPERGFITSANNKAASSRYFEGVFDTSMYTGRATRIQNMIQKEIKAGRKLNKQFMRSMQLDTVDVYCLELVKGMNRKLAQNKADYMFPFSVFQYFHCNFTSDSTTSTLYLAFLQNVYEELHPMGPNAIYNFGTLNSFYQYIYEFLLKDHTREQLKKLNNSMIDALRQVREHFNSDNPQQCLYGNFHRDIMIHRPFSHVQFLKPFVELQSPGFGNMNTPNVGFMNKFHEKDYRTSHRANLRFIISYYEDSQWILDGGSSEKWYSQYYTDQTAQFLAGNYYVMDPVNRTAPFL